MDWQLVLGVSVLGYLIGSISFARVIARLVARDVNVTELGVLPGDVGGAPMQLASATTVGARLGARYGMLAGILDVLKAVIPMLVCRWLFPGQPLYLILATAILLGHIWPVFFGFKGGRGMSVAVGGMLVLDPLGVLLMWLLGVVVGFVLRNGFVVFMGGMWLFVPWVWLRWHDLSYLLFAMVVNAIFIIALLPEVVKVLRQQGQETAMTFEEGMEFTPMGKGLLRIARRMRLYK